MVNNSYLGLIRQAQRSFDMDFCVQLGFENINMPESDGDLRGYGVDHQQVVEGLGCKSLRVTDRSRSRGALAQAQAMAREFRVPVVVEVILEKRHQHRDGHRDRRINEFEEIDCRHPQGREGLETAGLLD